MNNTALQNWSPTILDDAIKAMDKAERAKKRRVKKTKVVTPEDEQSNAVIDTEEVVPICTEKRRTRKFCLTTYIDRDAVLKFLEGSEWVSHWAVCTHDKDVTDDGQPKITHTHIVLYTYEGKTPTAVQKLFDRFSVDCYGFDNKQNTMVMPCIDIVAQYRYLLHLDDPKKHRYFDSERITENDAYWRKLERTAGLNDAADNKALQIFNDMLNGVSTHELIVRYGGNFLYHIQHFERAKQKHEMEMDAIMNGGKYVG